MAILENQPTNPNFLSQSGFRLNLTRMPNVNFWVTAASLPTVDLGFIDVGTPFVRLPNPGVNITFGDFNVTFKVDEDMKNYTEMLDWFYQLGFPDSFNQYTTNKVTGDLNGFSDGSLMIMSSKYNPNLEVQFQEMFPILMSQLDFTYDASDIEYLNCTVTFRYKKFTIKKL
jgi:hypothetical protein